MSTVKSVTTLAIIFAFLIEVKHEVGCLLRATEEFQWPGIELRSQQWAGTGSLNQFGRHQRRQGNNNDWGVECNGEALL
jgi:hypothetical protein